MTRKLPLFAPFVLAACGVAGPVEEPDYSSLDSEIVNGTVTTGHPSVGRIFFDDNEICTGTLVGARTVLTAAHCVVGPAAHLGFAVGNYLYPVSRAVVHPGWDEGADDGEGANDVALLLLGASPGVAPSQVATTAPFVGQQITLVGYGVTGEWEEDSGTKRYTNNAIRDVGTTKFYFLPGSRVGTTCYGDSGGPAFATAGGVQVQVGITSGGEAPCEEGWAWDTRVDKFVSWMKSVTSDVNTGLSTQSRPATDKTAPVVRITSPYSGQRVTRTPTVKATITDNIGVVRAELLVDGVVVSRLSTAPWVFTTRVAAGTRQLRVWGYDAAGNRGQYTVTVVAR